MARLPTSKADRSGVRTASDLERKYDLAGLVGAKKAMENSIEGINKTYATMEKFMVATLSTLDDLQSQIDGNITTWFYNGEPTLKGLPARKWTTDEQKQSHAGDLYYDKDTGYAYRFTSDDSGAYEWGRISDTDVTKALAIANAAQDTADSKRRVFTDTPIPPYDCGDMWFNNQEIYICQISKDEYQIYETKDFVAGTKYTDDTYAKKVGDELTVVKGTVTTIQESVDKFKVDISTTINTMSEELLVAQTSIEANTAEIDLRVKKNGIIAAINMSEEEVLIEAKRINLVGAVTAEMIDVDDLSALGARIGGWEITKTAIYNDALATDGYLRRAYIQSMSVGEAEKSWVFSIQKGTVKGEKPSNFNAIWKITGDGDMQTTGDIYADGLVWAGDHIHTDGYVSAKGSIYTDGFAQIEDVLQVHGGVNDGEYSFIQGKLSVGTTGYVNDSALYVKGKSRFNGDIQGNGENNVLAQDYVCHTMNAGSGSTGYWRFARITVTKAYANAPIEFTIIQRTRKGTLQIILNGTSTATTHTLNSAWQSGRLQQIYVVSVGSGVFDLYLTKQEAHDSASVTALQMSAYMRGSASGVEITWYNEYAASVPRRAIKAEYVMNEAATVAHYAKVSAGYDDTGNYELTAANLRCNSWLRSNGNTGWYNQTHGGGVFMQDSTWVRTYGNKGFYCDSTIQGATVTTNAGANLDTLEEFRKYFEFTNRKKLSFMGYAYGNSSTNYGATIRWGGSSLGGYVDDTYWLSMDYTGALRVGVQINNASQPTWHTK